MVPATLPTAHPVLDLDDPEATAVGELDVISICVINIYVFSFFLLFFLNVTQVQQRLESPTVTLTWHANKYKVQQLHQRYILMYIICIRECRQQNKALCGSWAPHRAGRPEYGVTNDDVENACSGYNLKK